MASNWQPDWYVDHRSCIQVGPLTVDYSTVFSRINESLAYGNENPLDYDAWDGYLANKNRTFKTLYDNNIGNNIMLSGDSHAVRQFEMNDLQLLTLFLELGDRFSLD